MNARTTARSLRTVAPCLLVGLGALLGTGCEPPPDTSPVIRITSPNADQILPVGQPIKVLFEISGTDASAGCEAGFPFKLSGSDIKECGRGQVRAYIGGVNFVARVNQVPASTTPWEIPNAAIVGDTAPYLTAGKKRLVFKLFYNDQPGTPVEPQRSAELYVTLQ